MLLKFSVESCVWKGSPNVAWVDTHNLPEQAILSPTDYKYLYPVLIFIFWLRCIMIKIYNVFSLHPYSLPEKRQKHKNKKMGEGEKKQEEEGEETLVSWEFLLSQNFCWDRILNSLEPSSILIESSNWIKIFFSHRRWDMWALAAIPVTVRIPESRCAEL